MRVTFLALFVFALTLDARGDDKPAPPNQGPAIAAPTDEVITCLSGRKIRWTGEAYVYVDEPAPTVTAPATVAAVTDDPDGRAALAEVNAKRAARGLRPFIYDAGLTQAARSCAAFRANNLLFGHTSNDFAFVPAGTTTTSAGCAAYPAEYGWMSCCVYEGYTYAGAAWVLGRDNKRYMHLFVR